MAKKGLGRGIDSLIPPNKSNNNEKEDIVEKKPEVELPQTRLSDEKIAEIKEEVEKNPRISLWSAKSASTLRYLKKVIPEFSISNEASTLLENAIKEKYPEIWELFDDIE